MRGNNVDRVIIWFLTMWRTGIVVIRRTVELPLEILEWLVGDVLARVGALPVYLLCQMWNHMVFARDEAVRQLCLHRATNGMVPLEIAAEMRVRQLVIIADAIHRLDREHARHAPRFRESLETLMQLHAQMLSELRGLAVDGRYDEQPREMVEAMLPKTTKLPPDAEGDEAEAA